MRTQSTAQNILAVNGSRLVLVDYGEATPSPLAPVFVEEETMVTRWAQNFCGEDMMELLGSKGNVDPYPEVGCQWVRGLVQQAIEKVPKRRGAH